MSTKLKYVGLDVHKDTTVVAIADGGRDGEVRVYGSISSDLHAVEKMMAKLRSDGSTLRVVYEAGPTGYVLYRRLLQLKIITKNGNAYARWILVEAAQHALLPPKVSTRLSLRQ